jgi:hypothetical protein
MLGPLSILDGGLGGGSLALGSSATTGNADVKSATGGNTFNIGGNPNVSNLLNSPVKLAIVGAVILVAFIAWRKFK